LHHLHHSFLFLPHHTSLSPPASAQIIQKLEKLKINQHFGKRTSNEVHAKDQGEQLKKVRSPLYLTLFRQMAFHLPFSMIISIFIYSAYILHPLCVCNYLYLCVYYASILRRIYDSKSTTYVCGDY